MTGTATETGWLPVSRDDKSAPFYDAAARGVLLIRKCRSCAQPSAPETTTCGACGSTDLDWIEATGNGQLVSWTVVHRPPIPAFADSTPYVLGLIELEEGPWVHSRLRGVDPAQLTAGADLSVMFVSPADSERYPVFTLRSTAE